MEFDMHQSATTPCHPHPATVSTAAAVLEALRVDETVHRLPATASAICPRSRGDRG